MRICFLVLTWFLAGTVTAARGEDAPPLPAGWTQGQTIELPSEQVAALSRKFGGEMVKITNVFYSFAGLTCQVNHLVCKTEPDAKSVHAALLKFKGDPATVRLDRKTVLELYCHDASIQRSAKYALGFQPKRIRYSVTFDAAPIETCDYMAWNRMFNLFLKLDAAKSAESRQAAKHEITSLAKKFQFGHRLILRRHGQGDEEIDFRFTPEPKKTKISKDGNFVTYEFGELPKKAGIPMVRVVAEVTSESFEAAPRSKGGKKPSKKLLAPTKRWPVKEPEIRRLAKEITAGQARDRDKTAAIFRWITQRQNLRYGGDVMGSRWGVNKALAQGFGHCWDYSDVFVTLCRASDIPARQVLGWLHGSSGHVWAEVYLEGEGWKQVDPTGVAACGSDYIPYFGTSDGEISLIYISAVEIVILSSSRN